MVSANPWQSTINIRMLLYFRYTAVLLVVHGGMVWTLMPLFRLSWHTLAVTRTQLLTPLGSLINFASSLTEWQSKLSDQRWLSRTRRRVFRDAISRVQTLALSNLAQAPFMPHFHPVGFEKVPIPREMFARILTGRKKAILEKRWDEVEDARSWLRWKLESCDPGMQNCALVVQSKHAKESHLVSHALLSYFSPRKIFVANFFSTGNVQYFHLKVWFISSKCTICHLNVQSLRSIWMFSIYLIIWYLKDFNKKCQDLAPVPPQKWSST